MITIIKNNILIIYVGINFTLLFIIYFYKLYFCIILYIYIYKHIYHIFSF